jgi:predicted Zn-dependent protease
MEFDILKIKENKSSLKAEGNLVNSIKNSKIERTGVRRFEGGRVYQTSVLGNLSEDKLISENKEWGGPGVVHDFGFSPPHVESRECPHVDLSLFEEYREALVVLTKKYPDFVFGGQCSVSNNSTHLKSSYGLDLHVSGGVCEWYFLYQRKGSGNMMDGYIVDRNPSPKILKSIEEHFEYIDCQSRVAKVENGKMPVLLAEPLVPLRKLTESFLVNKYYDGSGLYSGKLGGELFDKRVSLVDRNWDPSCGLFGFFDGEGTVRKVGDLKLVEKGKFNSVISDLKFGKKYSLQSSGNGLRTYNRGIGVNTNLLVFEKLQSPWRSIVKSLDRCLIALVAAGGESNELGEFSSPVQIGYIAEKGRLVGRAPQVTIKTSIDRYLKSDLIDISSDGFTLNSPSACLISYMDILVN